MVVSCWDIRCCCFNLHSIIYDGEQSRKTLCHLYFQLYFGGNEHFAICYHVCAIHASLPIGVYAIGRLCVSREKKKTNHKIIVHSKLAFKLIVIRRILFFVELKSKRRRLFLAHMRNWERAKCCCRCLFLYYYLFLFRPPSQIITSTKMSQKKEVQKRK